MPKSPELPQPSSNLAPAFTHAAIANQYARDVVAGEIVACKWVRLACKRHLDDLAAAKRGESAFIFDERKANHVCRFIECLPHTKGHWASKAETIKLEPWQCFILACLFGWLVAATRLRRFSLAYIAVPRKNGKSILGGGIGDYMFAADGEFGAEVYSGATTEKQAWEVFRPAQQMVQRTPELAAEFGITVAAKSLFIASNGSRFEPVIGKPGDGASPHCAIVDEYHEHDSDVLFDTMRTGMGARKQPLLLAITTAGDNMQGPCKLLQSDVEKVLEGTAQRDELFGIIYTIDRDDDWTSEIALRKANPNYGVSVFGDFLLTEQKAAISNARKQSIFQTKHLNVWVGAVAAYFNVQRWHELADRSLDPMEFRGMPCVIGLDISSKIDMTAFVVIFKKGHNGKDHYYLFPHCYLPEERAMSPEHQHYQGWTRESYIKTTPGPRIDYDAIRDDLIVAARQYKARMLCYDPHNAEHLAQQVEKATQAKAVEVIQKPFSLSDPMKQFEAAIAEGRIHHDGNPVFAASIANVVSNEDRSGLVFPRKERGDAFIDVAVAAITGLRMAFALPSASSVYESRGIRTL